MSTISTDRAERWHYLCRTELGFMAVVLLHFSVLRFDRSMVCRYLTKSDAMLEAFKYVTCTAVRCWRPEVDHLKPFAREKRETG